MYQGEKLGIKLYDNASMVCLGRQAHEQGFEDICGHR